MTRLLPDYSVFIRNPGTDKVVIVVVYVDSFLLFGPDMKEIESVKWWLAAHYKIKDLGLCSQFLGIKIEQDDKLRTISLSQNAYIDKELATADIDNCKGASSPMMANLNPIKNTEAAENEQLIRIYQSYVGT